MDSRTLLGIYFRQQGEMGMPDAVLDPDSIDLLLKPSVSPPRVSAPPPPSPPVSRPQETIRQRPAAPQIPPAIPGNSSLKSRLSSLRPVEQLMATATRPAQRPVAQTSVAPAAAAAATSAKREALKALFRAGCVACGFAEHRVKLVFGAGNADASIMIIGDVPVPAEGEHGIPFGGEAGGLLNNMLAAIGLDRTNDVFLTNVLKCPPSLGDTPSGAEIAACLPMLEKQIDIIKPKVLLLLGRSAANAVLGVRDDIAELRSKIRDYRGIPVMVTEHPAALLANPALKRAAWGDLQQFGKLLSSLGIYGSLDKK